MKFLLLQIQFKPWKLIKKFIEALLHPIFNSPPIPTQGHRFTPLPPNQPKGGVVIERNKYIKLAKLNITVYKHKYYNPQPTVCLNPTFT